MVFPVRNLDAIMHSFRIVIVKFFCVREGNALQGVSRWFRRIQTILRFHIDKYQPHTERFISYGKNENA